MVFVGDISIVNGLINQLITGGAQPCMMMIVTDVPSGKHTKSY